MIKILTTILLVIGIGISATAEAKSICVSFNLSSESEFGIFLSVLKRYEQYFPKGIDFGEEIQIQKQGKLGLLTCLTGSFTKAILISHAVRTGTFAFLVSPVPDHGFMTLYSKELSEIPIKDVNEIVLISCHTQEILKTYNRFKFWRSNGIQVTVPENPSIFSTENEQYSSIFQAANAVAAAIWESKFRTAPPFKNLEVLTDD